MMQCREIWVRSKAAFRKEFGDIHTRLMKNYELVLEWWFQLILVSMIGLAIFTC